MRGMKNATQAYKRRSLTPRGILGTDIHVLQHSVDTLPNAPRHPRPRARYMRDFVWRRRVHAVVMPRLPHFFNPCCYLFNLLQRSFGKYNSTTGFIFKDVSNNKPTVYLSVFDFRVPFWITPTFINVIDHSRN